MYDGPTQVLPPVPGPEPEPSRPGPPAWQVVLVAAVTTLVLVLPVAGYLVLRRDTRNVTEPAAPAPAPSATTEAPRSVPPPTTPRAPRPPDGRIALSVLQNATLTVPPWPADNLQGPHGPLRFRDGQVAVAPAESTVGQPPNGSVVVILAVTYGDVDRDGAEETVAELGCLVEGGSKQLVAFDRDGAGRIVTLGAVTATTGPVREIRTGSTRVARDGTVRMDVADYQVCCDDRTPQIWQNRGYRYHRGRFTQVSGSTTIPLNSSVTQLRLVAGELVLGPAVAGYRYGTVTVTVAHRWGTRPHHVMLWFSPPEGLQRAGTAWPPVSVDHTAFTVRWDTLASGATPASRTFAFRAPAAYTGGVLDLGVTAMTNRDRVLSDAVGYDNEAQARIRLAD